MLSIVSFSLLCLLKAVYGGVTVYTSTIPRMIIDEFHNLPARFGPDVPTDGLPGLLAVGVPLDGCTEMQKPPVTDNITGKWFVLVARYNCSFDTKVRNAQAAGFDCVIVHNVKSSDLENMSAKNQTGIEIHSVFVSDITGQTLADAYVFKHGEDLHLVSLRRNDINVSHVNDSAVSPPGHQQLALHTKQHRSQTIKSPKFSSNLTF